MNDEILKAYTFAKEKHAGQVYNRDGGIPYIQHCEGVYTIAISAEIERQINKIYMGQVALLHDTLEDTNTQYSELKEVFSKEVADGVLALTKNSKLPKEIAMRDSLLRIKAQPVEVQIVKLADRIYNLLKRDSSKSIAKNREYLEESEEILFFLSSANKELAETLRNLISESNLELIRLEAEQGGREGNKDSIIYFRPEKINLHAYDLDTGLTAELSDNKWKLSKTPYLGYLSLTDNIRFYTKEEAELLTNNNLPETFFTGMKNILTF